MYFKNFNKAIHPAENTLYMSRENLESRKENSIMYGVTLATANTVKTLNNNDMGSKVNRVKCTGEHVKNDIITGIRSGAVATITGAGVAAMVYKPQTGVKATALLGKGFGKLGQLLGKALPKAKWATFAAKLEQAGHKLVAAAPKYGKAAAIAAVVGAGVLALTKISTDHAYKSGQIDQKYIDNAKLEKMTNSVIV